MATLPEWVTELQLSRGTVPISAPEPPSRFRLSWRRPQAGRPSDILDGHTSGNNAEHQRTLDLVAAQTARLLAAWRTSSQVE